MSENSAKILPCKKHGAIPSWVEVRPEPWMNQSIAFGARPRRKLECFQCKLEEEEARNFPEIDAWNKKQKEPNAD